MLKWVMFLLALGCVAYASLNDYVDSEKTLVHLREKHHKPLQKGETRIIEYASSSVEGEPSYQLITFKIDETCFVNMVRLNPKAKDFWSKFSKESAVMAHEGLSGDGSRKDRSVMHWQKEALEMFIRQINRVGEPFHLSQMIEISFNKRVQSWVAYLTNYDPVQADFQNNHIEMQVSVATTPEFPGAVHMGIARSPFYPKDQFHKGASLILHDYAQRILRDLYPSQPRRYIFVLPTTTMLGILQKAVRPRSMALGTRETLGNLGMRESANLSEKDREKFKKNREFLRTSTYAQKYAPPILSRTPKGLLIYDWDNRYKIIFSPDSKGHMSGVISSGLGTDNDEFWRAATQFFSPTQVTIDSRTAFGWSDKK